MCYIYKYLKQKLFHLVCNFKFSFWPKLVYLSLKLQVIILLMINHPAKSTNTLSPSDNLDMNSTDALAGQTPSYWFDLQTGELSHTHCLFKMGL